MIWKKSCFSYATWILYMFIVGIGLVVSLAGVITQIGYSSMVGFVISVTVFCLGAALVWFLQKKSQSEITAIRIPFEETYLRKIEICTVGAIALIGAIIRIVGMKNAPTDHIYYQVARIATDAHVTDRVHGIDHLYVQLLHKLFYLFGNKIVVAYWLQMILQISGLIFGYFAVKMLAGYLPAMGMLLFGMISPQFHSEVYDLSPRMLYFLLFTIAMFLLGILLRNRPEKKKNWFLMGTVIGLMIYLDISGFGLVIVLVAGGLLTKDADAEKIQIPTGGLFFGLLGCLIGKVCALIVDSFASHTEISRVFWANVKLYIPDWPGLKSLDFLMNANMELIFLLVIMSVGIFSFRYNRNTDAGCVWVLLSTFGLFGMIMGFVPEEMNSPFWLYFYMSVLAGIGVQNIMKLFKFEFGDKKVLEEKSLPLEENKPKGEPGKVVTVEVDGQKKEVKLLDNPLPVPKKKIRKAMDYDIEVSDDDDYDVQ